MFILFFSLLLIQCEGKDGGKVFGGRFVRKGEFPSVAAVIGDSICGGTIVVLDKVITAAHCVMNIAKNVPKPIEQFTIYGGTFKIPVGGNQKAGEGAQERKISNVKIHERFKLVKGGVAFNDIALITLTKAFVQTETLSPAKLPSKNKNEFINKWKSLVSSEKKCVGVGWGATIYGKEKDKKGRPIPIKPSEDLKAVDLTPLEQKFCIGNKDMNEKGYVCVLSEVSKNESICIGDSGSPFYCDGYAFGLVSSVTKCGGYANVTYYVFLGLYLDYFGLGEERGQNIGSQLSFNYPFLFISTMLISHLP